MKSVQVIKTLAIAGLLAAGGCLAPAFAADNALDWKETGSVAFQFRYRPADLATQRGAHQVLRTLVYQANRACEDPGEAPLSLHRYDRGCVNALVERVVREINSEALAREWHGARRAGMEIALAQVLD